MLVSRECTVKGCDRLRFARGWCKMHYQRWRRNGHLHIVQAQVDRGVPLRFISEIVVLHNSDGCLVWPYSRLPDGRGQIWYEGRNQSASRVVCEIVHGPPPTLEHEVAHSCSKRHGGEGGCVNPRHLRWATHAENMADTVKHGTARRGEFHPLVKLTEVQVCEIRALKGKRPQQEIAEAFGVGRSTISAIHTYRNWFWL